MTGVDLKEEVDKLVQKQEGQEEKVLKVGKQKPVKEVFTDNETGLFGLHTV
jgi:hypothetical protein